jgi:hypothetical protein
MFTHCGFSKIPGLKGSLISGEPLAGLVWYYVTDKEELKKVLTDTDGVSHTWSLGIGKINLELKGEQRKVAASILPPPAAEVFQKTESPLI